jgi:hypothetical protein
MVSPRTRNCRAERHVVAVELQVDELRRIERIGVVDADQRAR